MFNDIMVLVILVIFFTILYIFCHIDLWNLYFGFANDWIKTRDTEQKYLNSLEENLHTIINPQELMLYDSLIELSQDTIKRHQSYADEFMGKMPKWYLSLRKRFVKL